MLDLQLLFHHRYPRVALNVGIFLGVQKLAFAGINKLMHSSLGQNPPKAGSVPTENKSAKTILADSPRY